MPLSEAMLKYANRRCGREFGGIGEAGRFLVEWWSGGVVEWWSGGVVEWWSGGVVEWWSGGVVEDAERGGRTPFC